MPADHRRYPEVKRHLVERIARGELEVGDRVPSEPDLVRELGVSRMTVHRAVRELADEGLLTRVPGVGTFVAERRVQAHPLEIRSIADEIRARGHAHSSRVLELAAIAAGVEQAERCRVVLGAKLFRSRIVHLEDGVPLQFEDRCVVPASAPDYLRQDFERTTPYDYLVRIAPLHRAEHTVRAVRPPVPVAKALRVGADEPCLLVRRRTWTADRVASIADLYYPGDRYELTGTFAPRGPDAAPA